MENIDYTLSLFDKKEEERIQSLKEEAFTQRQIKQDRIVLEEETEESKTVAEEKFSTVQNYLSELGKY